MGEHVCIILEALLELDLWETVLMGLLLTLLPNAHMHVHTGMYTFPSHIHGISF